MEETMTWVSFAVHIHKLTVMNVRSPRAFSSGNFVVLITAQIKANTPKPINVERPIFFCQSSRRFHIIVIGRSARAKSMNANQPTLLVSTQQHEGDGFNILAVNRAKSVSL